jgi:hypothetical protein
VPTSLAPLTEKHSLAVAFADLAKAGWVPQTSVPPGGSSEMHWVNVVRRYLLNEIHFRPESIEHIERQLASGITHA